VQKVKKVVCRMSVFQKRNGSAVKVLLDAKKCSTFEDRPQEDEKKCFAVNSKLEVSVT